LKLELETPKKIKKNKETNLPQIETPFSPGTAAIFVMI